jgi:hypothetical protein
MFLSIAREKIHVEMTWFGRLKVAVSMGAAYIIQLTGVDRLCQLAW